MSESDRDIDRKLLCGCCDVISSSVGVSGLCSRGSGEEFKKRELGGLFQTFARGEKIFGVFMN